MALSLFQIKRWIKMLSGQSIEHVNQNKGLCFSTEAISGYYNDLTEKVTKCPELINSIDLPVLELENKEKVYFPVAIFQYGLGCFDLYLISHDKRFLKKFYQCVDWAMEHLDNKGRWNNFFFYNASEPYGAMAQGEGTSLLLRAFLLTKQNIYLEAARKAIDFMLMPLELGGTTKYEKDDVYLMEYTFKGMVLNGAIFAWWGLYDYVKITNDNQKYKLLLQQSLRSLIKVLPSFKNMMWSMYDLDGLVASPFYHNLHIAQMEVMYKLTDENIFDEYAKRWRKQQKNPFCYGITFIRKALQKIRE